LIKNSLFLFFIFVPNFVCFSFVPGFDLFIFDFHFYPQQDPIGFTNKPSFLFYNFLRENNLFWNEKIGKSETKFENVGFDKADK
jgi:hypothetical protein